MLSNMFDGAMDRTVTVSGPDGAPAVTLKLVHAAAGAAAGLIVAPRATAAGALAAMLMGVQITLDETAAD